MTKLKEIRTHLQISQSELAELSCVNTRIIQGYEQGYRNIDGAKIETLLKLSQVLQCKISDLIENEELKEELKRSGY